MHAQARLTYPHRTGCGCRACCLVDARLEALSEAVDSRLADMDFVELRGLSYDYRDLIRGTRQDPGSFRKWLRNRIETQLIEGGRL